MHGWIVFLWAAIATILLIALGIFATLLISGRVSFTPTQAPTSSSTPVPTVEPIIDTTYSVLVLNATPVQGLATPLKDQIVAAGWPPENVNAGSASESGEYPNTTIFFTTAADEAAALGLAQTIGGAEVAQSDRNQPVDNPDQRLLTVVIGLDRAPAAE